MSARLEVRIEWLEAPGVVTPELAATWARYEIWLGSRCITQVETADGTFRRSVYGSLYPLAYWIASNWWLLTSHVRPSAVDTQYWTWRNVGNYRWLRQHNVRGAGDGMPWPDLTIVPEGAVTRIAWSSDAHRRLMPVRFASTGYGIVRTDDLRTELGTVVNHVLGRLAESRLPKTPLAEEWSEIGKIDSEEKGFCQTAARMGLDPYSVDDDTANTIIYVATQVPDSILDDFFDSADVTALTAAADWARQAISVASQAAGQARETLRDVHRAVKEAVFTAGDTDADQPWSAGYTMARQLRRELTLDSTERFDITPWVGVGNVDAASHGIYGCASVHDDRCGVVLGAQGLGASTTRFGQARALGRVLAHPGKHEYLLSTARSHDEKVARAFAAELLAPAQGIRAMLDAIGKNDDSALEATALQFQVSPLVVRHQYDNQIAASSYSD
jgi:hypothetical protein